LELEEENEEQRIAAVFAARAGTELRTQLMRNKDLWPPAVDQRSRKKIADKIGSMLTSMAAPREGVSIHGCSADERRKLFKWIDLATDGVSKKVATISDSLEKLSQKEHKIEGELKRVPAEDVLKPLLLELQEGYKKLAEADLSLNAISTDIQGQSSITILRNLLPYPNGPTRSERRDGPSFRTW